MGMIGPVPFILLRWGRCTAVSILYCPRRSGGGGGGQAAEVDSLSWLIYKKNTDRSVIRLGFGCLKLIERENKTTKTLHKTTKKV